MTAVPAGSTPGSSGVGATTVVQSGAQVAAAVSGPVTKVSSYISKPPGIVIILGIPVVLILGGTRFGPIVNLSLVAVLVGTIVKKGS